MTSTWDLKRAQAHWKLPIWQSFLMTASEVIEGPGFCVLGPFDIATVFFMFQDINQHKQNSMSFHYCFSSYLKVKCCNLRRGKMLSWLYCNGEKRKTNTETFYCWHWIVSIEFCFLAIAFKWYQRTPSPHSTAVQCFQAGMKKGGEAAVSLK